MEQVLTDSVADVNDFLNIIRPYGFIGKTFFEISWTLTPARLKATGRLNYWIDTCSAANLKLAKRLLEDLKAPRQVKQALDDFKNPLRVGFGIAEAADCCTLRLYLHGYRGPGKADYFDAWRWNTFGDVKKQVYTFQFDSNVTGNSIQRCVPVTFAGAFKKLSASPRFKQVSGYWVRKDVSGKTDNIYISLPWMPPAGELSGTADILHDLQIPDNLRQQIMDFPVRNIGYKLKNGVPEVTLYVSGQISGTVPRNEADLQELVLKSAGFAGRCAGLMLDSLRPIINNVPVSTAKAIHCVNLPAQGMNHHTPLFKGDGPFEEDAMDEALENAVKMLYPLLPGAGRVYDIGCGWGGPLAMISRDTDLRVLGLTPDEVQFKYLSMLGYNVRLGNALQLLPPGHFDAIMMLESFCGMAHKREFLQTLPAFTSKLVMRVNCHDNAKINGGFQQCANVLSSHKLKQVLEQTGWTITHWKDVRDQAMPAIGLWNNRLQTLSAECNNHTEKLHHWTVDVLRQSEAWAAANPLIELVAERY